jgi:catechol 2,3-dioxygenase-like lactoylglutathione lyase family enzyme
MTTTTSAAGASSEVRPTTDCSSLGYDAGLTCAFNVQELERSIAWYRDVLGFKLLYRIEELGWCELATEVPGVSVGLSEVEKVAQGGNATLTFGVRDIEHARRVLEEHEVQFDGATRMHEGMVKLATFFDPDGNTLMLYEDLRRPSSGPAVPAHVAR